MNSDFTRYARKALEAELARLDMERQRVTALLDTLGSSPNSRVVAGTGPRKRRRQMSEAGRQAIREAAKRRWAKVRAAKAGVSAAASSARLALRTTAGESGGTAPRRTRRTGTRKK